MRARLDELQGSRARIVEAGDAEPLVTTLRSAEKYV